MVKDFTCCTPFHSMVVPTGSLMPSASASSVVNVGLLVMTVTRTVDSPALDRVEHAIARCSASQQRMPVWLGVIDRPVGPSVIEASCAGRSSPVREAARSATTFSSSTVTSSPSVPGLEPEPAPHGRRRDLGPRSSRPRRAGASAVFSVISSASAWASSSV